MKPTFFLVRFLPALLLGLLTVTGAWAQTPELGAPAFSNLKWDRIHSEGFYGQAQNSIGMTTDGKVYTWGQNAYFEIQTNPYTTTGGLPTMGSGLGQYTPYYVPLPTGEVAKKVRAATALVNAIALTTAMSGSSFGCLTASGKLYGWGVNNGMFGTAWPVSPTDTSKVRRRPILITVPGETSLVDMDMKMGRLIVVASSGKAYFNGAFMVRTVSGSGPSHSGTTTFTPIAFPAGVNSATFKYTNVWLGVEDSNLPQIFLKGNDGNIYAAGSFLITNDNSGIASNRTTTNQTFNVATNSPVIVPFPAGEDIVKMEIKTPFSYALSASGKAYATGFWQRTAPANSNPYNFPLKNVPSATDVVRTIINPGDTIKTASKFLEMPLPAGIGATKFIDIVAANYNSYPASMYVVTDNNYVYWAGYNNVGMAIQNYVQYVPAGSEECHTTDGYLTNKSPYAFTVESINLRGTVKLFFNYGIGFAIPASGRGYAFGNGASTAAGVALAGIGRVYSDAQWRYPIPIANEQLDLCNSSPGTGGGGTTSGTASATGVINCAKTQLAPAPVVGVPGQTGLIVTIAVSATGTFSPITVSGSGMSLANGITALTASATGTQQFYIPIQYDGSALGTLNFTIGTATNAGSCAANLSSPPKQAITNIWTLDCVPTVGPPLK